MFHVTAHYEGGQSGNLDAWQRSVVAVAGRKADAQSRAYNCFGLVWFVAQFDLAVAKRRKLISNGIYATVREE